MTMASPPATGIRPSTVAPLAPPPVLTPAQIEHYMVEGYVIVSGLIPQHIAAAADAAAWRCNKYDPKDKSTWKADNVDTEFFTDPDLLAIYTPQMLTAASQLACTDPFQFPISRPQDSAFVIKLLPEASPWKIVDIHLDGTGSVFYETFSQPWKMFSMIYLHDIEPHGGGTVLFPRSHTKLMALARSEPQNYRWLNRLGDAIKAGKVDLGPHFEAQPKAGDVLFMSSMMVHCKPMNAGSRPRFAVNMKW